MMAILQSFSSTALNEIFNLKHDKKAARSSQTNTPLQLYAALILTNTLLWYFPHTEVWQIVLNSYWPQQMMAGSQNQYSRAPFQAHKWRGCASIGAFGTNSHGLPPTEAPANGPFFIHQCSQGLLHSASWHTFASAYKGQANNSQTP